MSENSSFIKIEQE